MGSTGSLTVVGNAAIRKSSTTTAAVSGLGGGDGNFHPGSAKTDPTNNIADNNEDCVLRNAGILSFPRGVSLTIAGGIEQTPTGIALVNLPPPLYFPGASYENQQPGEGGVAYENQWPGVGGIYYEEQRPGKGEVYWGNHPLVVEEGVTRLEGAVNASAWKGGGESERWVAL